MTSTTDRIIDLIDAGLQSSEEAAYGIDRRPDACARCQAHAPVDDGDLCDGCRAFLLEDSDADPAVRRLVFEDCVVTAERHDGLIRGGDSVTLTFEGCTFELEWSASSPLAPPYRGPARGPHADQYVGPVIELPRGCLDSLTRTSFAALDARADEDPVVEAWCPVCEADVAWVALHSDVDDGLADLVAPDVISIRPPRREAVELSCGHVVDQFSYRVDPRPRVEPLQPAPSGLRVR